MSVPDRRLAFSRRAQGDLRNIEAYTLLQWDRARWEDYQASLDRAFAAIFENPELGRARPELGARVRAHTAREHIIYYQSSDTIIHVLRIRHVRSDPRNALRGR